jgi:xanthine dehydrogenase small subunit
MRDAIVLYVNGARREVRGDAAFATLSDYLRENLRLTGTKVVCAEGDCGACTVLLGRPGGDRPWRFVPVNACIVTMAQVDGAHVLTVESVSEGGALHEVQRALCEGHGSQCGFCTPGFVMALLGHFEHHAEQPATAREVANHLTGNLCRCTGYLPILQAGQDVRPEQLRSVVARHHSPAVERSLEDATRAPLSIVTEAHGRVDAPTDLPSLRALRARHPGARIVSGNTDLGVLVNKQKLWPAGETRHAISLHLLRELEGITVADGVVTVGARATLSELERACAVAAPDLSSLLRVFASPQIKSIATLVGNVANGSPIGDTIPSLFALEAELELSSESGDRWLPIERYYLGYKQYALRPDEVVTRVRFRAVPAGTVFRAFKICQRRDLDISYVGAAFAIAHEGGVIREARLAYGGVGPTVIRLPGVEASLRGVNLADARAWESAAAAIESAVTPRSDLRGSERGRRILAGNLFRKLGHELRGPGLGAPGAPSASLQEVGR